MHLPLLGDLMLTHMAEDWIAGRIFSDKHINPHDEALIFAVFPAAREIMCASPAFEAAIRDQCGLIFEMLDKRFTDRSVKLKDGIGGSVRLLPVFPSCKMLRKEQLVPLQRAIDCVRHVSYGGRQRQLIKVN